MAKLLPIFIPTFCETQTIAKVLGRIPIRIADHDVVRVVVDDHSTDDTAEIARRYTDHVVVLERNMGVGCATKTGLEYIAAHFPDSDLMVKLDGDGQHDLRFLPQVVAELQRGADLVICSRFSPNSENGHTPIDRYLLNSMFANALQRVTGWQITDARSGFMGLRMKYVRAIAPALLVQRYGIPMEIILRVWNENRAARLTELAHPAMYGPVSAKLQHKYATERISDKASRLEMGFDALLLVLQDLGIDMSIFKEVRQFRTAAAV